MEQGKAGSMEAMRNEGETANKAMSLQVLVRSDGQIASQTCASAGAQTN
jgi:hypothetical protein